MRTFLFIGVVLAMPVIAWVPARFWVLCGEPWCLDFYPEWLDRSIYLLVAPYLSADMVIAAGQMEFIEVLLASTIILEIFSLGLIYLFKDKLSA